MSWQASRWAKSQRGFDSPVEKLVLMVLADYADSERFECWPSQKILAEDCAEITDRTVSKHLDNLENRGFITKLRKGNQWRPSLYRLNVLGPLAGADGKMPSEPENFSGASRSEPEDISGAHQSEPENFSGAPEKMPSEPEKNASAPVVPSNSNRHLEPSIEKVNKKKSIEPTKAEAVGDGFSPAPTPKFQQPDYWGPMTSLDGYSGHNVVNAIRYLERVCASAGVDPAHVVQGFSAFYEREGGMRDWKDPVVMLRRTCHIEIEKLLHPQLRFQTQSAKDYTDIPLREVKRV